MNKELIRKVAKLIYDERPGQIKYTLSPRELALGIIPIIAEEIKRELLVEMVDVPTQFAKYITNETWQNLWEDFE